MEGAGGAWVAPASLGKCFASRAMRQSKQSPDLPLCYSPRSWVLCCTISDPGPIHRLDTPRHRHDAVSGALRLKNQNHLLLYCSRFSCSAVSKPCRSPDPLCMGELAAHSAQ